MRWCSSPLTTNGAGADGGSSEPDISDDGNRIAFLSAASNLDPAATDGSARLYVRDVAERRTILAGRGAGRRRRAGRRRGPIAQR